MKKIFYVMVFFIPFLLMGQQGGRGDGGGRGGGGRGLQGPRAPAINMERRGAGMPKNIDERPHIEIPREAYRSEERPSYSKQIPDAIQKEIEQPSRIPSFDRKELMAHPETKNPKIPQNQTKQVPERVESFLERAKKVATPAKSQAVVPQHPAVASRGVQKNLNIQHPQMNNWFSQSFFRNHGFYPPYYRQNYYWWYQPNWFLINNFFGWGWTSAYDYETAAPVIINSPPVYNYNTTEYYTTIVQPSEEAPSAPEQPEEEPPEVSTDQATDDWLPLGVFEEGRSVEDAPYGQQFIQLAVDKQGTLAGSYYNSSTDTVHPLGGKIDKETQLAAWTVTDDASSPVMSTGIYNLTQDVVPVQVHFPNGIQQSWILVRLKGPTTGVNK
jgi:hypothetical protein